MMNDKQTLNSDSKFGSLVGRTPEMPNPSGQIRTTNLPCELQQHHIELEAANRQLRKIQKTFEVNQVRYASLFDNAPVGYVILDRFGSVKQFNKAFSKLIQTCGDVRHGMSFAGLLSVESASEFLARYKTFYNNPGGGTMQVRLKDSDSRERELLIKALSHSHHRGDSDHSLDELLITVTDISEISRARKDLERSLALARTREKEVMALLEGARTILEQSDFKTAARKMLTICSELIRSPWGYLALLSEEGEEYSLAFLGEGGQGFSQDWYLSEPARRLKERADRTRSILFDNNLKALEGSDITSRDNAHLYNAMFSPLVIDDQAVGILGLANKKNGFCAHDAQMVQGFCELAATGLRTSQNLEQLNRSEKSNKLLIRERQEALANIKQLSGLIPICANCKKIRDDRGYWNILESYIETHSEALFSHGICPECQEDLYGEHRWCTRRKRGRISG